jgi:hypothetical protein
MKNALRSLGLVTLVSLTWLSNAHAGNCSIRCSNGTIHNFSAVSAGACCSQIDTICPGGGTGTYNGAHCPL